MRTSCLVNNYNYRPYMEQALTSALNQSVPFDEIIVVDDGSTDDSVAFLREQYGNHSKIKLVIKENQGQLSAFNAGFLASSGDLIFFLDADDIYEPNYLEEILRYYQENPECDFLFCALQRFGLEQEIQSYFPENRKLGYSAIVAMYLHKWIGAPTSALSVRRSILRRFLPLPETLYELWRVRADDCIVYGASLVAAYKCYLNKPLVRYRIHGNNHFEGKNRVDYAYEFQRALALTGFFEHMTCSHRFNRHMIYKLIKGEFRSLEKPEKNNLHDYLAIVKSFPAPFWKKLELSFSLRLTYHTGRNRTSHA